ncbi:hypothetical protein HDU91_002718 [Kappamyces sp. JEL0680]|nr:hypothetical protein HDU91_002718 [Kappamyces sp. JEL0680]
MPLLLYLALAATCECVSPALPISWGFATSAYQIEGAWNADGKSANVWDTYFAANPSLENGFVAADHYHRMKSDMALLGSLNATAYRFSVAWSRILPSCNGQPNQAGIQFYSDMVDEIIKNGAAPVLTLFHWDTPQACHDQYQSWLSPKIVTDFTTYADTVFAALGTRLKYVLTINEPHAMCGYSYGGSHWPPAASGGDAATWACMRNVVLAHGSVVQMARKKYASLDLKFGMPLIISHGVPYTSSSADANAAVLWNNQQVDALWGALLHGDYLPYLDTLNNEFVVGSALKHFTAQEQSVIKGTLDFMAINYYSANYVSANPKVTVPAIGYSTGTDWQSAYPVGIRGISRWAANYSSLDIFITECGISVPNELAMTLSQVVSDSFRQTFFDGITAALSDAILVDKLPIKTFLAWSLMDNFEWLTYAEVFGLVAIDRQNGTLARNVKNSARSLSGFFSNAASPWRLPNPSPSQSVSTTTASSATPAPAAPSAKSSGTAASLACVVGLLAAVVLGL